MNKLSTVLILSDRHDIYEPAMKKLGKKGTYFPTAGLLTSELLSAPACCGVILDVKQVMETDATVRNRLFSLCQKLPMIRSRLDLANKKPIFLDPVENLRQATPVSRHRADPRSKVRLEASWSMDADPAMIETHEGVVLNLSISGAFLHATNVFPNEDYLHLKIFELKNMCPIYCAVRWRLTTPSIGKLTGVGLKFLDISKPQLEEIKNTYLAPAAQKNK